MTSELNGLTDQQLVDRVAVLATTERSATAALVAALAEFDARRLYLGAGCSSLFTYCTEVLCLSESAAYVRIEAARAARRFPRVLERLADGRLSLSTARMLTPVLTADNEARLLDAASFRTKREVEQLVAAERPQVPVATIVRKLPVGHPQPVTTSEATAAPLAVPESLPAPQHQDDRSPDPTATPARSAERLLSVPVVRALAPEMYKVQFTLSREGHERLRRAQDLLRHVNARGDIAAIFERALAALLAELERTKFAATERPRAASPRQTRSRHIPAAVKREVWARDDGRCAFIGTLGRCTERGFLEYHHVIPFADGGETSVENLQLRCAAHNAYESVLWSGADVVRERHAGTGSEHGSVRRAPLHQST